MFAAARTAPTRAAWKNPAHHRVLPFSIPHFRRVSRFGDELRAILIAGTKIVSRMKIDRNPCLAVLAATLTLAASPMAVLAQSAPRIIVPDASKVLAPPSAPANVSPQPTGTQTIELPDAAPDAPHLRFTAVRVAGATVVDAGEIAALFDSLRGRDVTAADLKAALDQANALYLKHGYPLGRAYVPAQVIQDGTLIVRVVEGYVGNYIVQADDDATRTLVEGYAARLTAEKPLTARTLQRYMLLIQDIPGITVGSRFEAMDPQTGATTIRISASIKALTANFYLDNRARIAGLPVTPYLIGQFNNVLGVGDQTTAMALLSPDQDRYAFYSLAFARPVGTDGLNMGLSASWAQALDTRSLYPFAVRSQTSQAAYTARYPVLRGTDETLNADTRLYYSHAAYSLSGIAVARDNYLAAQLGGDYVRAFSPTLGLGANLHLTQGLTGFGAPPHTRANITDDFTKLQGEARLVYQPLDHLSLIVKASGQYAATPLYAAEQISFGGLQYGRGFDSAEISGDSGIGFSFQPEYTIPFDLGDGGLAAGWSITPYLFTDYSKTYNRRAGGLPDAEQVSAGGGFRLAVSNLMTLTLEADKPLNRRPLYRPTGAARIYLGFEIGVDRAASLMAGSP